MADFAELKEKVSLEQAAQFLVVVNLEIGFSFADDALDDVFGAPFFPGPAGNELTIPHVCFFDLLAGLDAIELSHQAAHDVAVILRATNVEGRHHPDFHELGIEDVDLSIGDGFADRWN